MKSSLVGVEHVDRGLLDLFRQLRYQLFFLFVLLLQRLHFLQLGLVKLLVFFELFRPFVLVFLDHHQLVELVQLPDDK